MLYIQADYQKGWDELFCVNDTVVYGTSGVCTISNKTMMTFGKEKKEYFVLIPLKEHLSVIYVPADNAALLKKMRRVLSTEEIEDVIVRIATAPCDAWINDENQRRAAFKEVLQSGDRYRLIHMIKTIYLHGKEQKENGRKLHHSDEVVMKEAEALLYDELAYVLGLAHDEVLPFLINRMEG